MYRKTARYKQYENMRNSKERLRLEGDPIPYPRILPQKRREIIIKGYDFGKREFKMTLYKYRDRSDQYTVKIDGEVWKEAVSWTAILGYIRKAFPRVRAG